MTGVLGTPWYVNTYFDGITAPEAVVATGRMRTFWSGLSSSMVNSLEIQVEADVPVIDPGDGSVSGIFTVPPITALVTSGGTEPLPFANQGLVRLNTGSIINNRRVQGKLYLPGLLESHNNNGTPSPAIQSTVDALLPPMIGDLVVWARPVTPEEATPSRPARNGAAAAVTSAAMRDMWAIIRSRRD